MMWLWLALACAILILAVESAGHAALRLAGRIWLRHWSGRRHQVGTGPEASGDPDRLAEGAKIAMTMAVLAAGFALGAYPSAGKKELVITAGIFLTCAALFGRWIPRLAASRWPHSFAPALTPILELSAKLAAPLRVISGFLARAPESLESPNTPFREDVQKLLRDGESEGAGKPDELDIIGGVMHFGDTVLRDVMTPRTEIFAVDASESPLDSARRAAISGYSRIPVYRESLDEIIGMLHVFDLLSSGGSVMPSLRDVAYAPASKPCSEMLFEMLRAQRHLAVVLDEFGDTAGIVTLEDMLEELVGEIRDEHDESPESTIQLGAKWSNA